MPKKGSTSIHTDHKIAPEPERNTADGLGLLTFSTGKPPRKSMILDMSDGADCPLYKSGTTATKPAPNNAACQRMLRLSLMQTLCKQMAACMPQASFVAAKGSNMPPSDRASLQSLSCTVYCNSSEGTHTCVSKLVCYKPYVLLVPAVDVVDEHNPGLWCGPGLREVGAERAQLAILHVFVNFAAAATSLSFPCRSCMYSHAVCILI